MPKQPAGMTKSKRIESLRQIMMRWGRLNKKQIDSHMAAQLGADEAELARALYRDLEELVNNSELRVDYFTRDGVKLNDYDPELHKNTVAEWYFPGYEGQVLGHAALAKAGAQFVAPKVLLRDFKISNSKAEPAFSAVHMYFSFLQESFCVSLNLDALPVTLIVGRILPNSNNKIQLDAIRSKFGLRAVLLLTPVPNMSACRSENEPGHFMVEIKKPGHIRLRDLGSTNGTRCLKLTPEEADMLRHKSTLLGDATITSSWASTPQLKRDFIAIDKEAFQELPLPILIESSEKFRMMII